MSHTGYAGHEDNLTTETTALTTITTTDLLERRLLRELKDVLPGAYQEHLEAAREWYFHDYIPWERGQSFAFLGGKDWEPSRAKLSEPLVIALDLLLLDKDNLPSYNRVFTEHLHLREGWEKWIGQWTAEEAAHAIALRDYLMVTGASDPVLLEKRRLAHVSKGVDYPGRTALQTLVFAALHERVAADFTRAAIAVAAEEPVLKQLLERIAEDDELHAVFFGKVVRRGVEVAPGQIALALAAHLRDLDGQILGGDIDDYEYQLSVIAKAGLHSEATQRATIVQALVEWGVLELGAGLTSAAQEAVLELRDYAARS